MVTLESMQKQEDNVYYVNTHGTHGTYPARLTRNNIRELIRFLEGNTNERLYEIKPEQPDEPKSGR